MSGSLRTRVLGGGLLWGLGLLLAGIASSTALFRTHLEERNEALLEGHLEELLEILTVDGEGEVGFERNPSDPRFGLVGSGLYYQVEEERGPLLTSPSLGEELLGVSAAETAGRGALVVATGPGGREVFVLARAAPLAARPVWITVAAEGLVLDPSHGSHREMTGPLVGGLLGISALLLLAGLMTVRAGLAPLDVLRRRLAAVRRGDSGSLTGSYPAELQPLVDDLNDLLRSNDDLVSRARAEAGDLAHGLKTPLAVLENEAQRLAAGRESELADGLRRQIGKMRRSVDLHLARARAAAGGRRTRARSGVRAAAEGVLRAMRRLHGDRGLAIEGHLAGDPVFRGDSSDLEDVLGNLLDNACKWASSRVVLSSEGVGAEIVLSVEDDGPGVAAPVREEAFRRGARLDESKPGSGLGLAIVRDVVEQYGGSVELAESSLGGLRAVVTLPAAPADPSPGRPA